MLVIAAVAVYMAWQRWQTNRQKLRLHLYDRRLNVYEEVKNILRLATRDSNLSYADLSRFWLSASKADFLFGREIPAYIDEIHRQAVKLHYWNSARKYTKSRKTTPIKRRS